MTHLKPLCPFSPWSQSLAQPFSASSTVQWQAIHILFLHLAGSDRSYRVFGDGKGSIFYGSPHPVGLIQV
ncbi:hypothetical protein BT69DRAFT_892624 [Atractiella rhizophila]|nr:hypothetical protein BT69DRAFT_892624 [Atractiella rhizophila]